MRYFHALRYFTGEQVSYAEDMNARGSFVEKQMMQPKVTGYDQVIETTLALGVRALARTVARLSQDETSDGEVELLRVFESFDR